jgi:type VI secretion system protein ImpD
VDFSILFSGQDYARWRILQDSLDARFLGIMLPHILLKGPYSEAEKRRVPFVWEAKARYLWGNPAYSFAQVVMRSFSNFSWFGDIRGSNMQFGGGQVFDLPITKPDYDLPITENQPPIEVVFSDAQNSILSSYGFIALSVCRLRKHIVFLGNQSLYRPANRYEKKVVQANDNLAGLLQYMLCVSRFSHYLKVIVRDKIGKYTTLEDMESDLNHWLSNYVIGNEDAQFEIKSRYPLRSAKVQIKENATKPGSLACIIYLQPHFQLDHISAGFRLYTEMRSPTALS